MVGVEEVGGKLNKKLDFDALAIIVCLETTTQKKYVEFFYHLPPLPFRRIPYANKKQLKKKNQNSIFNVFSIFKITILPGEVSIFPDKFDSNSEFRW